MVTTHFPLIDLQNSKENQERQRKIQNLIEAQERQNRRIELRDKSNRSKLSGKIDRKMEIVELPARRRECAGNSGANDRLANGHHRRGDGRERLGLPSLCSGAPWLLLPQTKFKQKKKKISKNSFSWICFFLYLSLSLSSSLSFSLYFLFFGGFFDERVVFGARSEALREGSGLISDGGESILDRPIWEPVWLFWSMRAIFFPIKR